ncbi:YczE/YyaS/YitT family protein [Kiloniella laminariae]|uniref:membrane protein YczE n=1 Tax=Kiloniella laminariae TaxID=454162 RepID=UPI0003A7655C|nr:membrane protein [Kiloniella laminariae]
MKFFPRLSFLSVKAVPTLSWSSPKPLNLRPDLVTVILLIVGLIIFGLGEALLIAAGTGVSPWTVLAQGVSQQAGWSIGLSTFMVSLTVLILWWPLKQVPGIGTLLNAIIIALVLEFVLPYIPTPEIYISQVLLTLLGILITGLGSGIYLIANLGPGPRDGLMTGLQQQTNLPIAWIRSGIELSAVIIGWSLGGVVGLGTVLFAVLIGPSVACSLFILDQMFGGAEG